MSIVLRVLNQYMRMRCHGMLQTVQEEKLSARQGADKVTATQVPLIPYAGVKAYVRDVEQYFKEAYQDGSRLICFPELFGMLPCMLLPFVRRSLFTKKTVVSNEASTATSFDCRSYVKYLSFYTDSLKLLQQLAKKYHMYVASGSMYVMEKEHVYNRQYLIDADGEIIGHQDKLHLVDMERAMGVSPGHEMQVYDTAIGKLAIPICMDATYFETFRLAKAKGAEIIVLPIANMEPYAYYYALRGADMRVQEEEILCIKSALVAKDCLVEMSGKATIFDSFHYKETDGIAAQAKDSYGRYCISEKIQLGNASEGALRNASIEEQLKQAYKEWYSKKESR